MNFKGIKSTQFAEDGQRIVSGQKVMCYGRINPLELVEVTFCTDHGFRIQGNNLADAYITKVINQPSLYERIKGNIKLLYHNLWTHKVEKEDNCYLTINNQQSTIKFNYRTDSGGRIQGCFAPPDEVF